MKGRWKLAVAALGGLALMGGARPLLAQGYTAPRATTLWVDQKTGQVFVRPGRGRVAMSFGADPAQIEQQVEQRTEDKVRAAVAETRAQESADNLALEKQVGEMKPAWSSYMGGFQDKIRVGVLFYGDYSLYTHTGFGPQFLTQLNPPGPGNEMYNSFDITRTYLNVFFFPTKDWTFRFTPNLYRTIGGANDKYGKAGAIGTSLDGNLGLRVKYAYLQYGNLFSGIPALKGDTITIGQQANPLVGWEEDLYNFRYVNLTPWNYLSLSSSQAGVSMQGPVKFGGEKTYLDYDFGAFDNASFHALEQTNTKQVMARLTAFPFGANWRFQGLGLTGFYDYGYGNTTPDLANLPAALKGGNASIERIAALVHYTTEQWGIAGEFDYGRNAFSAGNLFSGSGPADAFGLGTTPYAPFSALAIGLQNNGQSRQVGYDFFGHYHFTGTKLTAFGMFEEFHPNDKVKLNPLDFQRFVVGLSYQYNEFLRFAVDSQNLLFYHSQFGFPTAYAKSFGVVPPKGTGATIPDAVPRDTHALFANIEFNY